MDLQSTPLATAGRVPTAPAPRKQSTTRPVPERTAEHAHLSLDELRGYRKTLADEESRVSYWRRIIQARLDVVRAGADADRDTLRPVLTDRRVGAGRQALVEIMPVDDIPPLPDLAGLWGRIVDQSDAEALAALEADLATAEQQLSEYRAVLHQKIGAATGELIARYREEPTLCLSALPLRATRRVASA
jgi:hypothetical protein